MKSDPEIQALEEALRSDLPDERQAARLRARFAALTVAGAAMAASSSAAASTLGAKAAGAGWFASATARVAALSWGAKVGLATAVSASVAAPAWILTSHAEPSRDTVAVVATPKAKRAAKTNVPSERRAVGAPSAPVVETSGAREETSDEPSASAVAPTGPRRVEPRRAAPAVAIAPAAAPAPEAAAVSTAAAAPTLAVADGFQSVTTLREETALVDQALAALRAGDLALARDRVQEHERRFPNGLLRRERERARAKLEETLRRSPPSE